MIEGMCRHITVVLGIITAVYFTTWLSMHPKILIGLTTALVAGVTIVSVTMIIGWVYYYFTERNKNGTVRTNGN